MAEVALDIAGKIKLLAEAIKSDPVSVDQKEIDRGEELLIIYRNEDFPKDSKGYSRYMGEAIQQVADDLSNKCRFLLDCAIGVVLHNDKLRTFMNEHGDTPDGELIFSVSLQDPDIVQQFRNGNADALSNDDLHAALYRLAFEWSKVL